MIKAIKTLAMALMISLGSIAGATADHTREHLVVGLHKAHVQMLYPVVQVQAANGSGSGTVIYSDEQNKEDAITTYILTNHHVIADSIEIIEQWSSENGKNIKIEKRTPVTVRFFRYNKLSRAIGTSGKTADIVAYDKTVDLALLKLHDVENSVQYVANLIPINSPLYLFKQTWAVGSGLGQPPFPTTGVLSNLDQRVDSNKMILSSAPIIFGNSGGALFHHSVKRDRYELIGVPSKVSAAGFSTIVSHMAWSIPMETVRKFLKDKKISLKPSE
jgi:S1-C subfamily serine protease